MVEKRKHADSKENEIQNKKRKLTAMGLVILCFTVQDRTYTGICNATLVHHKKEKGKGNVLAPEHLWLKCLKRVPKEADVSTLSIRTYSFNLNGRMYELVHPKGADIIALRAKAELTAFGYGIDAMLSTFRFSSHYDLLMNQMLPMQTDKRIAPRCWFLLNGEHYQGVLKKMEKEMLAIPKETLCSATKDHAVSGMSSFSLKDSDSGTPVFNDNGDVVAIIVGETGKYLVLSFLPLSVWSTQKNLGNQSAEGLGLVAPVA